MTDTPTAYEFASFIRARLAEWRAAQPSGSANVEAEEARVDAALDRARRGDQTGYEQLVRLAARWWRHPDYPHV